ncbi:hypothetical protein AB9G23_05700 [Francisella philomiragia]|uniref:hypothetical protein n=1 Tax=Francisella philomiragia TaxID=28110 RepID=UPI0019037443|nr:hypothetical protein [Francisella philomiragia]MBK2026522.1 hypothetical protein [Francisella philomiragia]
MLMFLSHAFEGFNKTRVPDGIKVIIYGSKGTGLTPFLAATAVQFNYENSHLSLDKRLKYLQIVQKLSSQEYNTNYQSDGAKILRGENIDPNTTRNYYISKDSAYPEIYNSGAYAPNMMFSNTGGSKDGATLVVKNLLDKMGCIYPIINLNKGVGSLSNLLDKVRDNIINGKIRSKDDELEVHIFGCRHTLSQHLKNMFHISSIKNAGSSAVPLGVLRQKIANASNSSVPFAMMESLRYLSTNFDQLFQGYNCEIDGDNGVSFRALYVLLKASLQNLLGIVLSGDIYKLSDPDIFEDFLGACIDSVSLMDIYEDTLYDLDQDFFVSDEINDQDTLDAVKHLMYLRSLCLTYMADIGYDRNKDNRSDVGGKSLFKNPFLPQGQIKDRIEHRFNSHKIKYDHSEKELIENENIYHQFCIAIDAIIARMHNDENVDKKNSFEKGMALLNTKSAFEQSVMAKKQTDGKKKAILLLQELYPILKQHRTGGIHFSNTESLKTILKVCKRYGISEKQISKKELIEY